MNLYELLNNLRNGEYVSIYELRKIVKYSLESKIIERKCVFSQETFFEYFDVDDEGYVYLIKDSTDDLLIQVLINYFFPQDSKTKKTQSQTYTNNNSKKEKSFLEQFYMSHLGNVPLYYLEVEFSWWTQGRCIREMSKQVKIVVPAFGEIIDVTLWKPVSHRSWDIDEGWITTSELDFLAKGKIRSKITFEESCTFEELKDVLGHYSIHFANKYTIVFRKFVDSYVVEVKMSLN